MFSVRGLVEGFRLFERGKVPLELKILGLAFYISSQALGGLPRPYLRSIRSPRLLLLSMKVYPSRNIYTSEHFIREVKVL